ncbi:hypothetical protein [Methylocaldum sp. 14B]|uniref:hypothetical protein n=1 Tax=Methylocaldum sp. 14B TaxID=1912213 RepID=UPI00098BA825|nr:hypothetical protein [Methylocaldum sp. 14B]
MATQEHNTTSDPVDDAHVIQDPSSAACALVMADTMLAVVSAAIDQFVATAQATGVIDIPESTKGHGLAEIIEVVRHRILRVADFLEETEDTMRLSTRPQEGNDHA